MKAQLIRTGLTRGQPRACSMPPHGARLYDGSIRRQYPTHRRSADPTTNSLLNLDSTVDYSYRYGLQSRHNSMLSAIPGELRVEAFAKRGDSYSLIVAQVLPTRRSTICPPFHSAIP
jgi:hypothetical protein